MKCRPTAHFQLSEQVFISSPLELPEFSYTQVLGLVPHPCGLEAQKILDKGNGMTLTGAGNSITGRYPREESQSPSIHAKEPDASLDRSQV